MRPSKTFRFRLPPALARRRLDLAAVSALLALTLLAAWDLLHGETLVGEDPATQYYPWYSFLGESLRSGHLPGWNPHQFSGAPFAADPLSGWTYLPAMLLFASLPLVAAAKGYMLWHLLLAGLSTYALGRSLGMKASGALLAAIAYEYSGFLYLYNICCSPYAAVMSWLPLALLGAELAIRSSRWLERVLWWGLSGLALSQILAAWLGQGSYYALLALGGYIAYRTLLSPPPGGGISGMRSRLLGCVLHGGAVLVFGFGLAAAGVLPRLEYNALSNLAGGYPATESGGGWSVSDWGSLLEPGDYWYAGVIILALALVALPIARRRFAVPYFAALSLCALILSGEDPTPLHSVLYLLPYFERLHPHDPERVIMVFYLGTALLAGATLTGLGERAGRRPLLLVLPVLAVFLLATASTLLPPGGVSETAGGWGALSTLLSEGGVTIPAGPLLASILAVALVAAYALIPARLAAWRGLAFASLALVVFVDLFTADRAAIAEHPGGVGVKIDLAAYYRPSDADRFLRSREEPFRYFGYYLAGKSSVSDLQWFEEPKVHTLKGSNLAIPMGLQNIQGYSAIHLARYDEYLKALNGHEQDYHFADVYEKGFDSPLLDLLNARYAIVPADTSPEYLASLQRSERAYPMVYEDDQLEVLENEEALPRAWIVHSAQQVESGEDALELLNSGEVNPKETALLEEKPPEVSQPEDASADRASFEEYEADRVRLKTVTEAPGLLVLSEVYYPAWKAYVDGQPVPVRVADHLLRSVAVPAGEHEVELRYESWTLRVGVAISLAVSLALVALAVGVVARRWRRGRGGGEPTTTSGGPW